MNRSGMSVLRSIRFRSAMLGITFGMAFGLAAMTAGQGAAAAQSVLRIAVTAADIPDWRGQPDQGFEGNRFVGFSLYDTLIEWDLSSRESEVGLRPGWRRPGRSILPITRNGFSISAKASSFRNHSCFVFPVSSGDRV